MLRPLEHLLFPKIVWTTVIKITIHYDMVDEMKVILQMYLCGGYFDICLHISGKGK
jgi:hypothetical protein